MPDYIPDGLTKPLEFGWWDHIDTSSVQIMKLLQLKERVFVKNSANDLSNYVLKHWPILAGETGVWIVGSTAYLLAQGKEPSGDLDLICQDTDTVERIASKLRYETDDILSQMSMKTYLGGDRVQYRGNQVDLWALQAGQTIDDAINGFSKTHPHARVSYEIATGKLVIYPNENVSDYAAPAPTKVYYADRSK